MEATSSDCGNGDTKMDDQSYKCDDGDGWNIFGIKSKENKNIGKMPTKRYASEYNMNHKKRGMAIIFNQENFDALGLDPRIGSQNDWKRLKKTFENLSFSVEIHHDLTLDEIKREIRKASKIDHKDSDCIAISILTHGDPGILYAKDTKYELSEISEYFAANNCLSLAGKPKLFFIQACRGKKLDQGTKMRYLIETDTNESKSKSMIYKIPNEADFLFVYSSADGYFSFRNSEKGSWFIQCLCDVLDESGKEEDIDFILTVVRQRVAYDYESHSAKIEIDKMKQVPCSTSMLLRILKFNKK